LVDGYRAGGHDGSGLVVVNIPETFYELLRRLGVTRLIPCRPFQPPGPTVRKAGVPLAAPSADRITARPSAARVLHPCTTTEAVPTEKSPGPAPGPILVTRRRGPWSTRPGDLHTRHLRRPAASCAPAGTAWTPFEEGPREQQSVPVRCAGHDP
jgi:hypothetical protein